VKNKKDVKPKKKNGPDRQLPLTPRADKAVKKTAGRPSLRKNTEKLPSQPPPNVDEQLDKDKTALLNGLSVLKAELGIQNEKLKNALLELETSRDKYRHLYNTTPVAYFTLDNKASVISANAASSELFGAGKRGLAGSAFTSLVEPGAQDTFRLAMSKMFDTGEKQSCEIDMVKADGTVFSAYLEIAGIPKPDGVIDSIRVIAVDITERKRVVEELRKSEERYRLLLENVSDSIYVIDRDFNLLPVTPHLGKLLGYSPEESQGKNLKDLGFLLPVSLELAISSLERVFSGETIPTAEVRLTTKDGTYRYHEISAAPLVRDGEVIAAVCVARDITERKLAEKTLIKAEERYRLLIENTSDGMYIIDRDFNINPLTPNIGKMLGYSLEDMAGKKLPDLDFMFTASLQLAMSNFQRVLAGEVVSTAEYEFVAKDGTVRYQDISGAPLVRDGKIVAAVCVARDITERKLAEQALQASEEKYRMLLENASEGIAVVQDGVFKFFNNKLLDLVGYDADEIRAKPFVEVIYPEDRSMVAERHLKRLKGEQFEDIYSFRFIRKSGDLKWVELKVALIEWEGRPATLNFLTDITERKKAEEALQKSEEKYRTLIENANEGIAVVQDGAFKFFNVKFLALTGYDADEMRSRPFVGLIFPEDRDIVVNRYRRRLKGEQLDGTFSFRCMHKSGDLIWVEINSALIEWEDRPATLNFLTDITKRKEAEQALQQEKDWVKELLDIAGVMIVVLDAEAKVTLANAKACEILECSLENIVGKSWITFLPEGSRDAVEATIARLISGETEMDKYIENPVLTCKGEERIIAWHNTVIRDNKGLINGTLSSGKDITERKKAENKLASSEEKYRTLVENASEGIIISQDGQFKYLNPKMMEISGYTIEELMAGKILDFIYPEDRKLVIQNELRRLSGEQFENRYPFRAIHKQGDIKWIETNSILIGWEGRPATLNFLTDITERKKAEEELKQSSERYRDLFEHSGSAIVIIDENGRYLMANRKVADSYGITPEEFVRKSVYDFVPQEMADRYMKSNRRLLSTGEQREYEDTLSLPTGERSFLFIDTCLKDQNGRYFAIQSSSINITDCKKAEQSLEASNTSLKKTLNDAVNTMAKIVEIRDPYTAGHQNRVTQLCAAIAVEIGLDDAAIERLKMAAIIHDIGKIYVPAEILSKFGKLGNIEFGIIQTHPTHGYNIVKNMDLPSAIAETIVQHHERLDGSGYPNGLKGDSIILGARILAVADVVEAMVSHRPYRPAKGLDSALEEILKNRGKLYDPDIVDACVRLFSEKGFQFKE
jgi:PAS domain S-box-containing protein/putative nucleotidyltransferase with HDIG domain